MKGRACHFAEAINEDLLAFIEAGPRAPRPIERPEREHSVPRPSIIDTRRDQMFPVLGPSEVERLRRFGKVRSYAPGEALAKAGEAGHGLAIVLTGTVAP